MSLWHPRGRAPLPTAAHRPHSLSCCQGALLAGNFHADRGAHQNPTAATWDLSSWEAPLFDVRAGLQQAQAELPRSSFNYREAAALQLGAVFDPLCSGCSGKDLSVCPSPLPPHTTPPLLLLLLKARAEGFPPCSQQIPVCSSLLCVYLAELWLVLHKLLILTGSPVEEQRYTALLHLGKQNNLFLTYGIRETSTCSPQYFLINTPRLS